ncbi:MAG: hypothetical protein IPK80_01915 [Nannocystis sp.]|nr:hypothetical protein [Nannocystis sp.]
MASSIVSGGGGAGGAFARAFAGAVVVDRCHDGGTDAGRAGATATASGAAVSPPGGAAVGIASNSGLTGLIAAGGGRGVNRRVSRTVA